MCQSVVMLMGVQMFANTGKKSEYSSSHGYCY